MTDTEPADTTRTGDTGAARRDSRPGTRTRLPLGFWPLWGATGLSNLGDSVAFVAAGLLALTLTGDERLLSVVTATTFGAWIVLALPVGIVVDRLDRQRLMVTANLVRVLACGAIALLAIGDELSIWSLLALLAVIGSAEVVFDSTGQAIVPMLVPGNQLARANGLVFAAELIAGTIIGLALGAVLFDIGDGVPFAINALAYAVAAAMMLTVRFRYVPPVDLTVQPSGSMRSSIVWLWRNDLLRLIAGLTALAGLCYMLSVGIIVKFAIVELGLSNIEFGILIAINAIGAAAGGLAGATVIEALGNRWALVVSYAVVALGMISIGAVGPVWVIAAAYACIGFFLMVWNVATLTIRQEQITPEQFGRVNGVFRWITGVTNVVGIVAGGFIAYATSLPMPFIVGGVAMLVFGIVAAVPLRVALDRVA
jgi:MFS family permease